MRASRPELVHNPDDVNPGWLTKVFNYAGLQGVIESLNSASIGTGQVGENVRFELEGSTGLPTSVVGKFASLDPVSKQTGILLQNYVREVFFYQQIQDSVDVRTPKVFFTDINPETHDFVILMEDLSPGLPGDQLAGCSVDEAALALEELAKLHGPRWGDASLFQFELFKETDDESANTTESLYEQVMPGFIERYQDRLNTEQISMVEQTCRVLLPYANNYQNEKTLIHIDYRLDNMMFGGPYPLTVVDWQSIQMGCALNDVSYFIGTSLLPEERRKSERDLVNHYYDVLKSYKVNLSADDCWKYYRHYAPAGLIMAVIASMIVGETERGNDMFMAMATRSSDMCTDLESIQLLKS
jgi:hypothetical protein